MLTKMACLYLTDNYFGTWHYEKYCSQLRPTASLAGCNISHNAMCRSNYLLLIVDPHEILLLCVCVGSSILVARM